MSDIKYSVIIPLYNKGPHIARAIKSVLEQKYTGFELIVVDDASTDGGLETVKSFDDSRIKIIESSENNPAGGSRARNIGINAAVENWVSFLDADDEWKPDYLSNITGLYNKFPNAKMLGSGWLNFFNEDTSEYNKYYNLNKDGGDHLYDFKTFLQNSISNCNPIWTSVATINREVILAVGGFPEQGRMLGEDLDTWFRVMMQGKTAAWSASIGAVYYRDSVNMATKRNAPRINENHLIKSIDKYLNGELDDDIRNLLLNYKSVIRRNMLKDLTEYRFSKFCRLVLGDKGARTFLSYLVKKKRGMK
jgi:glycosyltransferase involved in cell wall biosynthesis